MDYPRLPAELSAQLDLVEASIDGALRYAPCRVRTTDGSALDRVYVVDAASYLAVWGIDPGEDSAKSVVLIEDVAALESSPVRLPARFADELYQAGESGMGYVVFTVRLRDGRELAFQMGNAVDFPDWPDGVGPDDVERVVPHTGRQDPSPRGGAPYAWCLYDGSRGEEHRPFT